MRSYPVHATVTAATIAVLFAGCSSESDDDADQTAAQTSPTEPTTTTGATTPEPGAVAVSPGGVTTAVGAPADSTENEYFQACYAARQWMEQQDGDPKSQIEPYLAMLQSSDEAGPSTFGTPWSELAPMRQAAVIVAVEAAADQLCG